MQWCWGALSGERSVTVPWGYQEDPPRGVAQGKLEHPGERWGANFWHPSSQPLPPRPHAQLPPHITASQCSLGKRVGVLSCGTGESGRGSAELMDGCRKPPGKAGGSACACPKDTAESGQGHGITGGAHGRDIWGQMKWEEGSGRRAGCVSVREGDNLCRVQLFPPQHLISALARSAKAAAAPAML